MLLQPQPDSQTSSGRTEVVGQRQTRDLDSLDCFGGVVGDVDVDADGLSVVIQLLTMHDGKQRQINLGLFKSDIFSVCARACMCVHLLVQ